MSAILSGNNIWNYNQVAVASAILAQNSISQFVTLLGSDAFTHVNGTLLNSYGLWTNDVAAAALAANRLVVIGNAIGVPTVGTGSAGGAVYWIGSGNSMLNAKLEITCPLTAPNFPDTAGCLIFWANPTSIADDGYYIGFNTNIDATFYSIGHALNGGYTPLAVSVNSPSLGDTIAGQIEKLEDGSVQLSFFLNGVLNTTVNLPQESLSEFPITPSGVYGVMCMDGLKSNTAGYLDNFNIYAI